ncbi:unnamed protein product, partial [Polarella glacialis]
NPTYPFTAWRLSDDQQFLEMQAMAPAAAGEEVMICYGEGSRAEVLAVHGYLPPENEADFVRLFESPADLVARVAKLADCTHSMAPRLLLLESATNADGILAVRPGGLAACAFLLSSIEVAIAEEQDLQEFKEIWSIGAGHNILEAAALAPARRRELRKQALAVATAVVDEALAPLAHPASDAEEAQRLEESLSQGDLGGRAKALQAARFRLGIKRLLYAFNQQASEWGAGSPHEKINFFRQTDVEKLLQASGSHTVYQDLLRTAPADPDDNKTRLLGPMPSILCVLEKLSGLPVIEVDHLRKGQLPNTLEFDGADGALLVPSLDAMPLLKAAGAGSFERVTVSVEVNSDASNHGLGVMLEISPLVEGGAEKQEGDGKNYIKFHPGMWDGLMRVEGPGGWPNHLTGFAPHNWTGSGQKFHRLHLVLNANGDNLVRIEGTNAGEVFEAPWTNQLTDGRYLPSVYAWLDCGECEPVVIGKITMRVHCTE